MTTVQHTECDSCGKAVTDPADLPDWIISGRINAGLRIDVCKQCFSSRKVVGIVANAKRRGLFT